ncbi:MAG: hypothetical protein ACRDS1_03325 [Pseudonocardiaceae bacterium]
MPDPAFDVGDYELLWPRHLFIRGLTAVRATAASRTARIERLLEEAFLGDTPIQDYKSLDRGWPMPEHRDYVTELLAHAPRLREYRAPRPYWSARHGATPSGIPRRPGQLPVDFARLIWSLQAEGYLDCALPKVCVDDPDGVEPDPEALLADRIGVPDLWPLPPEDWSKDLFYDLIEVFHDLVARPRTRSPHSWNQCGWHFGDFATDIGRALYRWKVNTLLESGGVALRLAEDVGRLVQLIDDARTELVQRTVGTPNPGVADRVAHAVALFRGRAATEHDKRSAIFTLANVLEDRRRLLKDTLFRKDEGALFHIANEFDLRHHNDKQHTDYDPVFLDWVFWWYLATVELTDRLLARQDAEHGP